MRRFYPLLFIAAVISCSPKTSTNLSEEDVQAINQIRSSYVNGWLAGDSETVLGLFDTNATIIPSGMAPIQGIGAIENYWFPNDSSVTTIHSYEIELIELNGTKDIAYSLEKGVLDFTYEKGDFSMSKTSVSHATTVFQKNGEGEWKVISRMWTPLN